MSLAGLLNISVCPAAMNTNNTYRLYSLAHARLGYEDYMGPFGHGSRSTGSMQVECPCTGPCTSCLMYRHLKNQHHSLPPPPPTLEKWQAAPVGCCAQPETEWKQGTYNCFSNDLRGCLMFFPGVMCCCIPTCMAICDIGQRIGTQEAIDHTSFKGQCTNFWASLFFCFYCMCPAYVSHNYSTKVLETAPIRTRTLTLTTMGRSSR